MAPDGTTIVDKDNDRYDLEDGPEIVKLNFAHTNLSDNGIWRCKVFVESEHYGVSMGRLSSFDSSVIGDPLEVDIQLTIIGKFQCIHMKVYLPQQSQSLGESHPVPAQLLPIYKFCKRQNCVFTNTCNANSANLHTACICCLTL